MSFATKGPSTATTGSRSSARRSEAAKAWRHLYSTAEWYAARETQLEKQPLCEECLQAGHEVAATVVNHRTPHKGDLVLFRDQENHQSVCKPHHDGMIQRSEQLGFKPTVDEGGWPTDPRHRANRIGRC